MNPITDDTKAAFFLTAEIKRNIDLCRMELAQATTAFECGCPMRTKRLLEHARGGLIKLRRSQTAALKRIDDALASADSILKRTSKGGE